MNENNKKFLWFIAIAIALVLVILVVFFFYYVRSSNRNNDNLDYNPLIQNAEQPASSTSARDKIIQSVSDSEKQCVAGCVKSTGKTLRECAESCGIQR